MTNLRNKNKNDKTFYLGDKQQNYRKYEKEMISTRFVFQSRKKEGVKKKRWQNVTGQSRIRDNACLIVCLNSTKLLKQSRSVFNHCKCSMFCAMRKSRDPDLLGVFRVNLENSACSSRLQQQQHHHQHLSVSSC